MLPYPKRFFVVGTGRTGTTHLLGILRQHPEISKAVFEPTQYGNESVESCFRRAYGVKEICKPSTKQFVDQTLRLPIKVIHTVRVNLLRQAVSMCLARRLDIWQRDKVPVAEYPKFIEGLGSLPLEDVINEAESLRNFENAMLSRLNNKPHMTVVYEDFYFGSEEYQKKSILEMLDFIGVTDPYITPRMIDLLRNGRLNNEEVYRHISNVKEIDNKLSEYGSLLNYHCPVV